MQQKEVGITSAISIREYCVRRHVGHVLQQTVEALMRFNNDKFVACNVRITTKLRNTRRRLEHKSMMSLV